MSYKSIKELEPKPDLSQCYKYYNLARASTRQGYASNSFNSSMQEYNYKNIDYHRSLCCKIDKIVEKTQV